MARSEIKKPDRRTLYTRQVIKGAFLSLKKALSFNAISVSALCREAGISRGTFYLHYQNTMDVLDDILEDILPQINDLMPQVSLASADTPCRLSPFCVFMRKNANYHCIFLDDSLDSYLMEKILSKYRETAIKELKAHSDLSEAQLETVLYFQFSGCFAAAKRNIRIGDGEWCQMQAVLDTFIRNGLKGCISGS